MNKIKSPNKAFTGTRAGVSFIKGEAETDNQWAIDWFKTNGYEVEEEQQVSTDKPINKLTKDEIKAKLEELEVQYETDANKEDLLELLKTTLEAREKGEGGEA